jgi:serine/threonine-protein kinase
MANKIGRFEILSEITHSEIGAVYKAADPESGQTIALKTIQLQMLGDQASVLVDHILQEAESTKPLSSHNISQLYGLEEIDGEFCATMEYVQGNSIGTMLARKEGFSIWDLQDIVRQTCQGLDHAHSHRVVHYSLEPAKIMVTWDGTVKVLSFGISTMGAFTCQASGPAPPVLHYVSPEQLRGDPVDGSSNFFSLGAILYEMVTERKAFPGDNADQVRQAIVETTPTSPVEINPKIHPVLSEAIMKALAKAPEARYQSGQELVNDLERCKESPAQPVANKALPAAAGLKSPPASPASPKPKAPAAKRASAAEPVKPVGAESRASAAAQAKSAAAAAGGESAARHTSVDQVKTPRAVQLPPKAGAETNPQEKASAAAEIAELPAQTPARPVDPMMAEQSHGGVRGPSFSEISELPPLKEVYVPPPPLPVEEPEGLELQASTVHKQPPEKPKLQPREVARRAVKEIKRTPPKLFLYSIAGAAAIMVLVVGLIAFRIHSENSAEQSSSPAAPAESSAVAPRNSPQPPAAAPRPAPPRAERVVARREPVAVSVTSKYRKKTKASPAAVTVIPGQLTINSTPEGAEVRVDGHSDPSWVTPFNLAGLSPGQHSVTVSRAGFASESRTIEVASGSKSFLVVQLAAVSATVAVNSEPAGAQIFVDGKDTGRITPAQVAIDKPGAHTFLVRKQGYLEETSTASLQAGQIFRFAPTLKALGTTDEIKIGGGKFKKLFGGGEIAGMGTVSVKTQPKGAQVTVNNRIVDKFSPVDFYLNPGTYVIDITLSGYKRIHRVVEVQKGSKVAVDENLERE